MIYLEDFLAMKDVGMSYKFHEQQKVIQTL